MTVAVWIFSFFFFITRPPPRSTLFPYTTLFRSLEQHRDEPFFLYAHATDPHAPYRPPAGFEEKFANPAETAEFNRNYVKLRDKAQYGGGTVVRDRKSTRLNFSHSSISYAVFCLK